MNRRMYLGCVVLALIVMVTPFIVAEEDSKSAAAPAGNTAASDPLVRVLVSKGVITAEEARFITSGTAAEQREKLLYLLKDKGLLTRAELEDLNAPPAQPPAGYRTTVLTTTSAISQQAKPAEPPKPPAPTVIPAVVPLRVLQLDPSKKDGLIPDIKLGSGARIKLYGFIKMSSVEDSSSPYGNDFPLPGFIGSVDTGPNTGSEFHIKARASRFGANFEWPDISPNLTFTGKVEMDFEGNFSRANNRNISTIRSSMMSIRLAYGRLDYKLNPNTSLFALFGQDWTPFASSTLPNLLETTGLGLSFGTLYEREPQVRVGMLHNFGGSRKFSIGPEFAIVLPTSGNPPTSPNPSTVFNAPAVFGGLDNQLGYGERQGPDSGRPQIQGRLVFQWQLDKAAGVAPAQLIFSAMNGQRQVNIPFAAFNAAPTTALTPGQAATLALVKAAYPRGAEINSSQNGGTIELQLPTRFMTLIAKYYNGEDLRNYFAGGLYSTFNDTVGLTNTITVAGVDGNAVVFGTNGAGAGIAAAQRPVRTEGGFVNLGIPLGRVFHADPVSRAAGWQLYLHYGLDQPYARDARRTAAIGATSGGNRDKSDLTAATLYWKVNSLVTFGYEESYYRTLLTGGTAVFGTPGYTTPVWNGLPVRQWHDVRSEFSTIFTF